MRRISSTGALLLFAAALSACSTDNRERIAMQTLYGDNGMAPESGPSHPLPAMTGALNAMFPAGSDSRLLRDYVARLNGRCDDAQSGARLACSVTETSSLCQRASIGITAKIEAHKIVGLEATKYLEGC